jgi:YgiT-type zinc finger domain-containing protein
MMNPASESLVETRVTYTIELNGQIFMIENVPARVNEETGEQLFAPSTVESIQRLILNRRILPLTNDLRQRQNT